MQHSCPPRQVEGCDWESTYGQFILWDDGHVPEHLRHQTDLQQTLLVRDPHYHQPQQNEVHTVDDSVHESLVEAIYKYTVQQSTPWGSYVRIDQIQDEWNRHGASYHPSVSSRTTQDSEEEEEEMHVKVAAAYLYHVIQLMQESNSATDVLKDAHGIAIWGLAATEGSQVTYHLDYAEQLRYQYNVIIPPIYAGTLQCSDIAERMKGGCYCVHTAGLKHYEKYGFKGKKSGNGNFPEDMLNDVSEGPWLKIPYRCNRMIVQRGHLPHLSTPIESLPSGMKRVIVGFNVFRHNVGPFVERAPEHSSAFRRRVALQGILGGKSSLSLASVRGNPALAKLLVQAKRQKIKNELLQQQNEVDERIDMLLKQQKPRNVGDLIECLARQDGVWPNADDIHVHIHHRCKQGRWVQVETESLKQQLVSTMAFVTLSEEQK